MACGRFIQTNEPPEHVHAICKIAEDGHGCPTADIAERLSICNCCKHQIAECRCKYIELGCKRAFCALVRTAEAECPVGNWPNRITTLNLIYHVCPLLRNDVWRANLWQLRKRLSLQCYDQGDDQRYIFNGRKLIAVAVDESTHDVDEVRRELNRDDCEFVRCDNDPELREVATFEILLEHVANTSKHEATFYAHTKGNSTGDDSLGAELWRNEMYRALLDNVEAARDLMQKYTCVGTHKLRWERDSKSPYPTGINNAYCWMYCGTFFWFRHADVFGKDWRKAILSDRYGAENWLGNLLPSSEAATLFQPWQSNRHPVSSPYNARWYTWPIRD